MNKHDALRFFWYKLIEIVTIVLTNKTTERVGVGVHIERMTAEAAADVLEQVAAGKFVQTLHADGTERVQISATAEMVAIDRALFLLVKQA